MITRCLTRSVLAGVFLCSMLVMFGSQAFAGESRQAFDERMAWWREARFGMFIHWGLYAVPAGQWKASTGHAEWILTTAQIPVNEYEKFALQFNPVKFNAAEWVRMAKDAGMKYIVITSKHHDGFCLFDSGFTDYDVMDATPFKRDIMKELSEECRKQGIRMCWYHSIMDWHHPDYLPRRDWEDRSAEGADFGRYVQYLRGQVKELVTNYGQIGVLWFDGEWEHTWNADLGDDLYDYVRSLQPGIIVNNRVSKGRAGMEGTFDPARFAGDFGTPEQEIPATGLGYDWETCMTMNNHWGYNKHDNNWKSTEDLIRKLVDIASKGGNFLLNIGPRADGTFPDDSVIRLAEIGKWMKVNGESVYGTQASVFDGLAWGRCTTRDRILYLHVFDWPADGKLEVPGLLTQVESAYLLAEPAAKLDVSAGLGGVIVSVPAAAPDPVDSVIVLRLKDSPEVVRLPVISCAGDIFCTTCEVTLSSDLKGARIYYTLDGTEPTEGSNLYKGPIELADTTTVKCRIYRDGRAVSGVVSRVFTKVQPREAEKIADLKPGLVYKYYTGDWTELAGFERLSAVASGLVEQFSIDKKTQPEYFGFRFTGYIKVPADGVYSFYLNSDDGSRLCIGETVVVDNDGLHAAQEVVGAIALAGGYHPVRVDFFQRAGSVEFDVSWSGPGIDKGPVPAGMLFHRDSD